MSTSVIPSEEIHFAVGQALVEASTGRMPKLGSAPMGFARPDDAEQEALLVVGARAADTRKAEAEDATTCVVCCEARAVVALCAWF